jgi:hypothetical protein
VEDLGRDRDVVEDPGRDRDGVEVEVASGGFDGKGVTIRIGGADGEADEIEEAEEIELDDIEVLADEGTKGIEVDEKIEDWVTTDDAELDAEVPCKVTRLELLDEEVDIEDELVVDKEIERVGVQEVRLLVELAEFDEVVITLELLYMELDGDIVTLELLYMELDMELDMKVVDTGLDVLDEDVEVVELAKQRRRV